MLGEGRISCHSQTLKPSTLAFLPRKIMLNKLNQKASSRASIGNGSLGDGTAPSSMEGGQKTLDSNQKGLRQMIALYLKKHGFSKTLAAFRSESQCEVDDKKHALDLEDMYFKYLETICENLELDLTNSAIADSGRGVATKKLKDENNMDAIDKVSHSKKRTENKGNQSVLESAPDNNLRSAPDNNLRVKNDDSDLATVNGQNISLDGSPKKSKDKKKKKSKTLSESGEVHKEDPKDLDAVGDLKRKKSKSDAEDKCKEIISDNSHVNTTGKKKKKNKDLVKLDKTDDGTPFEKDAKPKDKKKKKKKDDSLSGDLPDGSGQPDDPESFEEEDKGMSEDSETAYDLNKSKSMKIKYNKKSSDNLLVTADNSSRKHQKEEKLTHDENIHDSKDIDRAGKKDSKKRKRKDTEEAASLVENVTETQDRKQKGKGGLEESIDKEDEPAQAKKKKAEKVVKTYKERPKAKDLESLPAKGDGKANVDGNDNGSIMKKENEGHSALKSKKESNGSAEPKTFKAFQRVKVEEVKFVDDRLQDNSYWGKDGADSGYGAKAQEILGQVKGKDFRHEKTKKKRGSYRGGQIDLQSHSIKFNYSDEE
ncbi:suppressor protein SRP40 isoform X2 [Amborella trichopoda]|uniref:suppressor protein SRP40 isoform X2 n=1 Tax=Amborella trichopoda TaxID=13333 RepID=UPI0005D44135|nr:suppressor protein SRP40 isoform X2 [Amborella trichopoda]|eukprot:XP_011620761.1 suppressor protein SRP40 isoform X2 [Amborella trichopoda]